MELFWKFIICIFNALHFFWGGGVSKTEIYVDEDDIGTITIKSVDDPRTLNKQLVIRPPTNILSFNELIEIWEKKIGHTLQKSYIPESTLRKQLDGKEF